jgi:hypothetical protein
MHTNTVTLSGRNKIFLWTDQMLIAFMSLIRPLLRIILPVTVRDDMYIKYEQLKLNIRDFRVINPILIYQMGKVGSSSVLRSLESANLPNPIYHVHCLSDAGIKRAEDHYLSLRSTIPRHIRFCSILRDKVDKEFSNTQWQVVTLVREPIIRMISDFFQNVDVYWPHLVGEDGRVKKQDALTFLKDMFLDYDETTDYACTWFDREIKSLLKVDVYNYPFDNQKGYTLVNERNVRILIFRTENLNAVFENAMLEFLGIDIPIRLIKDNVGITKAYTNEYQYVLDNISLPKSLCRRIYSSRYARHFYPPSMRNIFASKWSRELFEECD